MYSVLDFTGLLSVGYHSSLETLFYDILLSLSYRVLFRLKETRVRAELSARSRASYDQTEILSQYHVNLTRFSLNNFPLHTCKLTPFWLGDVTLNTHLSSVDIDTDLFISPIIHFWNNFSDSPCLPWGSFGGWYELILRSQAFLRASFSGCSVSLLSPRASTMSALYVFWLHSVFSMIHLSLSELNSFDTIQSYASRPKTNATSCQVLFALKVRVLRLQIPLATQSWWRRWSRPFAWSWRPTLTGWYIPCFVSDPRSPSGSVGTVHGRPANKRIQDGHFLYKNHHWASSYGHQLQFRFWFQLGLKSLSRTYLTQCCSLASSLSSWRSWRSGCSPLPNQLRLKRLRLPRDRVVFHLLWPLFRPTSTTCFLSLVRNLCLFSLWCMAGGGGEILYDSECSMKRIYSI